MNFEYLPWVLIANRNVPIWNSLKNKKSFQDSIYTTYIPLLKLKLVEEGLQTVKVKFAVFSQIEKIREDIQVSK